MTLGTYPNKAFETFLKKLSLDLQQCGTSIAPVKIRIQGFASSSEVKNFKACNGAKTSDEANRIIAEKRQENIQEILKQCNLDVQSETNIACKQQSKRLKVISERWASFNEMVASRRYNDRWLNSANSYSTERGIINRRVEVQLTSLGECELGNFAHIKNLKEISTIKISPQEP